MQTAFYIAAVIAVIATALTITRRNAVHALLYLVLSLLAVAVVFYTIGAPFIAALEVIIYAGAIMVLFIFVVMMLNLGRAAAEQEGRWQKPGMWIGPTILAAALIAELAYVVSAGGAAGAANPIEPREVGIALFGPYLIGVELASLLLMAGLVGAYHLGVRTRQRAEEASGADTHEPSVVAGGSPVRAGAGRSSGAA